MTTQETKFHVILFPADGRAPHLVNMPVSAVGPDYYMYSIYSPEAALVPHPEIHMEYIAVAETIGGPAHQALRVDALDFMTTKLTRPYTIFYPVIARDGMPFPINKCVREIQQGRGLIGNQWRGDLVVAAYSDATYTALVPAKMSDFPIIKNFFMTNMSPVKGT
jgi:hypothetical protein